METMLPSYIRYIWIPPKTNMCIAIWQPLEGPGAKKAELDMAIRYRFHISPHMPCIWEVYANVVGVYNISCLNNLFYCLLVLV